MTLLPVLAAPTGLSPGDHLCWTYQDDGDLAAALVTFLDEGRRRGEQLLVVGPASRDELVDVVAGLPGRDELIASGQLELRPTSQAYGVGGALDPTSQVEVLRAETAAAVARGRTGLRIAADVTELGRDRGTLRALQRYERAVDAVFDTEPVTAMCIYSEALGDTVLASLAVLHPLQHRPHRQPALHVAVRGRRVALEGELDVVAADEVSNVLDDLQQTTRGDVTVDLSELAFLDVAGARVLAEAVAAFAVEGRALRLREPSRNAARCLALFGLPATVPAQAGER